MTKIYMTPSVLHILECDSDGNTQIVRYYREDIVANFVKQTQLALDRIEKEADRGKQTGGSE